jgi:hypothetical protein
MFGKDYKKLKQKVRMSINFTMQAVEVSSSLPFTEFPSPRLVQPLFQIKV